MNKSHSEQDDEANKETEEPHDEVEAAAAEEDDVEDEEAYVEEATEQSDDPNESTTTATATTNTATTALAQHDRDASSRKRRSVPTGKLDLYQHFTILPHRRATTKAGKDLGMYLAVCRYCQDAHARGDLATPPTPLVRTRRNCVNHHKRCAYLPAAVKAQGPPPPVGTAAHAAKKHKANTNNISMYATVPSPTTWRVTVDPSLKIA